jgi:hypothetical protein
MTRAKLDELQVAEALDVPSNAIRRKQHRRRSASIQAGPEESLNDFLARVRPSMTLEELDMFNNAASTSSRPNVSSAWRWISVQDPHRQRLANMMMMMGDKTQCIHELKSLVDAWSDRLPVLDASEVATEARFVSANIFALAKRYNYGAGKLLLSIHAECVDQMWSKVAHATVEGKLGLEATISSIRENQQHVLSIAVDCFWNEARMRLILFNLAHLGLHVTAFTPTIFSGLAGYNFKALHLHTLLYNPVE